MTDMAFEVYSETDESGLRHHGVRDTVTGVDVLVFMNPNMASKVCEIMNDGESNAHNALVKACNEMGILLAFDDED